MRSLNWNFLDVFTRQYGPEENPTLLLLNIMAYNDLWFGRGGQAWSLGKPNLKIILGFMILSLEYIGFPCCVVYA